MDIAVQFEKINLGEGKYVFKPITIIRGEFLEDRGIFISESGTVCKLIDGGSSYDEDFFGFPTSIEELKSQYGRDSSDEDLLSNYFSMSLDNYYLGIESEDSIIDVLQIPVDQIERQLQKSEQTHNNQVKISFSLDSLKFLRNSKSLEEVKSILDNLIELADDVKEKNGSAFESVEEQNKSISKNVKKSKLKIDQEGSKKFNLADLREEVLSKIIAQDKAVNKVTTAIAVNYTSKNPRHKSHILIAGPSGTGKTEMISIIADYLGVPYFKADATAYTKEGYVGKSVYSMLTGLIDAADGNIEKAQNGILIIDEIDKKAGGDRSDVGGQTVLNSLLKIMDRSVIEVNTDYYDTVNFDTSNLTIIFMGAFADLFKRKSREGSKSVIGFGETNTEKNTDSIEITKQDLIDDGMTAEFMGRIDELVFTDSFTLEGLVELIYKSKISPIKREKQWFADLGVDAYFSRGFCVEIAKKCLKANTGAREIKNNVKVALESAYEEVLMNKKKIMKMRFTKETVLDPKKYYVE